MELQRHLLVAFKDYYGICDLTDFKLCDDDKIIPSYHNVLYDEVYWHKRGLPTTTTTAIIKCLHYNR